MNNYDGTLTVANSTFSDNGAAYSGGGIVNDGTLTVINSSFSGNDAGISGGGIVNGGTLTVTNSTFNDNRTVGGFPVSADGGGIYSGTTATLTVTNSTFVRNSAVGLGGGIAGSFGAVTITNTIIASITTPSFGLGPHNVAVSVDDSRLYITHTGSNVVTFYDIHNRIPVFAGQHTTVPGANVFGISAIPQSVPGPSALVLLLTGGLSVAAMSWRRSRRSRSRVAPVSVLTR